MTVNNQGWIAASPRATPPTSLLVMEDGWTQNASHLTCEYLGFKGAYATTAQVAQNDTFGDQINGITNISCPEDAVKHHAMLVRRPKDFRGRVCCGGFLLSRYCDSYLLHQSYTLYRQLRARRALLQLKDVPLRTRRALLLYKVNGNSALLVLNGTSLICNSALLALS